jgi:hypothetical protein
MGHGIKAKIWANRSQKNEVWFNVEIVRVYKDGDRFKESTQFKWNDLALVEKAAHMAFAWILEQSMPAQDEATE